MFLADTVLMIRPLHFGFNEEAFLTNKFQQRITDLTDQQVQQKALQEFDDFVKLLRGAGIHVEIFEDTDMHFTPDAIFPNNWFSTHSSGHLVTYPMAHQNRQLERRSDIINKLIKKYGYSKHEALEHYEESGQSLEGTGSLIFDHENKIVYAAISPRTQIELVHEIANLLSYEAITFKAMGGSNELIYHTNVMLCIGHSYAIVGADTIVSEDRKSVLDALQSSGKTLLTLTNEQVYQSFAGNMLQLQNDKGKTILILSDSAMNSLSENQLDFINQNNDQTLVATIPTIEKVGGGSARCMLAEIFYPHT